MVGGARKRERFGRKVSRLTLDWSVETQSLIDARRRHVVKVQRAAATREVERARAAIDAAFTRLVEAAG